MLKDTYEYMSVCIEPGCSAPTENKQARCKAHRNAQLRERYREDADYRADLLAQQRARGTTPLRRRYLSDKLAEQEGRCAICGEAIPQGKAESHIDHKVPSSRGGNDDGSNIQAVCARCNRRKGVRTQDEMLAQTTLPFPVPE